VRHLIRKPPERTQEEIQSFWRSPDDVNAPETYLNASGARSEYLVSLMDRFADSSDSIFEVGCNAGRNLGYLFRAGYAHLGALEISSDALDCLRRELPDVDGAAQLFEGTAESILPTLADGQFDVVYSMAVLVHIHPDSEAEVFGNIARVAGRRIITIEDERCRSWRHFERNYRQVFEPLGFRQVHKDRRIPGIPRSYVGRVFERA
jgi:SAM-dependent methyltransferase